MMDELVSTALLGTRGATARITTLPDDVANVLPAGAAPAEEMLLDAAAAMALYARAGAKPREGVLLPAPAGADRWAECSSGAAAILAQVLEESMQPLLLEWLTLAARAERRPPHHLLPKLLDAAAARRALRTPVSAVIDERGRWLTQFNLKWQFTGAGDRPPLEQWQLGNRQQRAEALRAVRSSDPELARELITNTWGEDAAELRAEWVEGLLVNLSEADEAFLESRLDDRSARVRAAAADLLCRLPDSRLVARMAARVSPLVTFQPGVEGNVLKLTRGKPASWRVALPEAFDKEMLRDGLVEKPDQSIGPKQWWLQQMIGCVPLDHWTRATGAHATELVGAAGGEFAAVLTRGWLAALARRPVVAWIEPLLAVAGPEVCQAPSVLQAVPLASRHKVMKELSGRVAQNAHLLNSLIEAWRPLDQATSDQLFESFDILALLMSEAHFALHASSIPRWERALTTWRKAAEHQRRVDQVFAILAMRRVLHQEFTR